MKPSAKAARLMDLANRYGARNYAPLPVVLERGEGVYVYDTEGREYIDFLSSYSALSHGHRHPRIGGRRPGAAGQLTLTSRAFHNAEMGPFLHELCEYAGMSMALPMNTGAEAVETAIKAARKWAYAVKGVPRHEADIIVCADNFHGRTVTIISFSTENLYRDDFGPFTPGFTVIPYGDAEALEAAITPNTAAFLVEPLQGEAGVAVPPAGFLEQSAGALRQERRPLRARRGADGPGPHRHGASATSTRTCTPTWSSSARRWAAASTRSAPWSARWRSSASSAPASTAPRSAATRSAPPWPARRCGCWKKSSWPRARRSWASTSWAACAPSTARTSRKCAARACSSALVLHPDAGGARRFCVALMEEGLLCKETHEDVIRFAPPLVISREQLDWALERVEKVITTI